MHPQLRPQTHPQPRYLAWLLFAVPTLFYSLTCVLRVALGTFRSDMMSHYEIENCSFVWLPALYYLGYALMQLPVGIVMDRIALRILMPASMLLSGLGVWMLYCSGFFVVACIGSLLIGVGTIMSVLGASNIIYDNFAKRSYGFVFGLALTTGFVSAACSDAAIANFLTYASWKDFYFIAVLLFIALAVLSVIFIKPEPMIKLRGTHKAFSVGESLSKIFKDPFLVSLSLFCAFMAGSIYGFADVWSKPFLQEVFGLSALEAADVSAMCFWGYAVGAPTISGIAQKYGKMRLGLIFCGLLIVIPFAIIFSLPGNLSKTCLAALLFVVGVGSVFSTITFAMILQAVDERLSNMAIGFANMLLMLFGFVYHFFIGVFYDTSPLLAVSIVPLGAAVGVAGLVWLFRKNRAI